MRDEEIIALLQKYQTGNLTDEERAMLESWYLTKLTNNQQDINEQDIARNLEAIAGNLPLKQASVRWYRQPWLKVAAAAVVLITIGAGLYFYLTPAASTQPQAVAQTTANEVVPGGNKAILVLADGKQISLTDAQNGTLAREGNTNIDKTSEGQVTYTYGRSDNSNPTPLAWHTIKTPRGGQFALLLPDGTKVILNAASSLRFPARFMGNTRDVELTGEAYFEVARNKSMPFHVKTDKQDVEVLGTHFNINSYTDEPVVKTTLLEGSVKVTAGSQQSEVGSKTAAVLKPGQQAILSRTAQTKVPDNTSAIAVRTVNTATAVAWKNGEFMFRDEPLANIMRAVARWYDVEIVYRSNVSSKAVWGSITRYSNVKEVLEMIELTGAAKFTMEGRKIIVQ